VTRSVRPLGRVRVVLAGGLLALGLAACAGPAPSASPVVDATSSLGPSANVGSAAPSDAATSAATAAASGSTAVIVVDDALLALLPTEVDGVALTPDRETAAELAADAALGVAVGSLAVATAFGPLATDGSADYVVVTVVGLKPRTFSDGFFRDWRDSFDAAVCEQAGGVSGHAESEIGGHPTWIGTCSGGVHTWHATLRDDAVIVSMQGSGAARYGEQVIAGLTE
jgi:hypothetical protein